MYKCEKCGKEVIELYGSGRFCSRACANSRKHSEKTKRKISESAKKYSREHRSKNICFTKRVCALCGKEISIRQYKKHIQSHDHLYRTGNGCLLNVTEKEVIFYREIHKTCEICGKALGCYNPRSKQHVALCVDHNHETGNFRGVLCSVCNRQLGWYEKHRKSIENYLKRDS